MKKRYIFFGIIGILLCFLVSPLGLLGSILAIGISTLAGLLVPWVILYDKNKINQEDKIIEDPIKLVKYLFILTIIIAIPLAMLCTTTSILISK